MNQAQILALQAPQVAKHFVLAVVLAEDRLLHERSDAGKGAEVRCRHSARNIRNLWSRLAGASGEDVNHILKVGGGDGFIKSHAKRSIGIGAEVDLLRGSCSQHALLRGTTAKLDTHGVKPRVCSAIVTKRAQCSSKRVGGAVHTIGDRLQAFGTMPCPVHAGDDCKKYLRGADVAGGALALDVLLARLDRHAESRCAGGVAAHADQSTRHPAYVFGLGGEVRGVRTTEAHRYAESLRAADHYVGAPLAGRGQ